MIRDSNRDLRGALRELLIIIAGVLVALGANAWWQGRSDREREREYLEQLNIDLTTTRANLDAALADETRVAAAGDSLLRQLRSGHPFNADSLKSWSQLVGHYSDPRLVLGTLNALQQTGDLRLIRDRRVRVGVSAYITGSAADWSEFSRWIDRGLQAFPIFQELAIRRGLIDPGKADNLERSIVALRGAPETMIALRAASSAAHNRQDYLGRMSAQTDSLLMRIRAARR